MKPLPETSRTGAETAVRTFSAQAPSIAAVTFGSSVASRQRDRSAVEARESADDRRLGRLRVERQAVASRDDDGTQARQPDRRVAMGDIATCHRLEEARERAGVDNSRVGGDLGAERPDGEATEAADRAEAVGLALRLRDRRRASPR